MIAEFYDDFIVFCRIQRQLSDNTIRAYRQDLASFTKFCVKTSNNEVQNGETILEYVEFLSKVKELSPSTVKRRILTLQAYFKWLKDSDRVDRSPFDDLVLELRVPQRLPRPVDRHILSRLLTSTPRFRQPALDSSRHKEEIEIDSLEVTGLILRILLCTGLRIGEITHIKLHDISIDGSVINVVGKGNRERAVYIENAALLKDIAR